MWEEEYTGQEPWSTTSSAFARPIQFNTHQRTFKPPSQTFANSGLDLVGHRLDNGRLELLSVLGVGAYGVVYLAVDLQAQTPTYLAIKCLLRAGLDSRQRHFQRREMALHQLASRHPNIVTLHKVIEEGDCVYVIMDYCDEGDLFEMITERQRYLGNDQLIKRVFLQIIDAVEYCHSLGIFHRDLKPENILCKRDGTQVCIADFGLATSERTSAEFGCGSTFYLSPECQGGLFERLETYDTRANDVWSLGVILVNLSCGRNPWRQACPTDETFRAFVQDPEFLQTILPISDATHRILKETFTLDPRKRISLARMREMVMEIETFTMNEEQLRTAHSAARALAAPKVDVDRYDSTLNPTLGASLFPFDRTPSLVAPSGRRGSESSSSEPDTSLPTTPQSQVFEQEALYSDPWSLGKARELQSYF